jgi:SNF2 family DNA or RNA helicase
MLSETSAPSEFCLKPYQQRGVEWLKSHPIGALSCAMGSGKTAMACSALPPGKVVIVAPLRVCRSVWPDELDRWAPGRSYVILSGSAVQREAAMALDTEIFIVNYELISWAVEAGVFNGAECVILDELSRLKGHGTTFKALRKVLPKIPVRWGLTGTLISQGVIDAWAQVWCLDLGQALGRSFASFTRNYLIQGREYWDLTPQEGSSERIAAKIAPLIFRIEPAEYADQLPPLVINHLPVALPSGVQARYREFAKTFVLGDATAGSSGVLTNKLTQLAQGAVYPDRVRGDRALARWYHIEKITAAAGFLDSLDEDNLPCIVVYQYLFELEAMRERCPGPVLGAGSGAVEAARLEEEWNSGRLPVLYLHPKAGGHGLNLQAGGRHILWLGPPWSLDLWSQVNARLHRQGAEGPTWATVLVAADTVDEDVLQALEAKADVRDAVDQALKKILDA